MKLVSRNVLVVMIATATLLGGLFNPPYVEPGQAANVPSIERLHFEDRAESYVHPQPQPRSASLPSSGTIERHGQIYVPIRDYVEAHRGRLIYNRETTSVDITVDDVSFSLLLGEGIVMSNGRATEGGYFVQNGTAYIAIEALADLIDDSASTSPA